MKFATLAYQMRFPEFTANLSSLHLPANPAPSVLDSGVVAIPGEFPGKLKNIAETATIGNETLLSLFAQVSERSGLWGWCSFGGLAVAEVREEGAATH